MSDIAIRDKGELAQRQPASGNVAAQLMKVIEANPTAGPENLKALLDGMERVTKWQAEQEFTAAFARLKFPPFVKNRKGHTSKYAALDDIQEVIEPILSAEGFTLTYSSGEANAKGEIPTFGLLSHVGGHSRQAVIYLPPDGVATKSGGMNMNALQSVGSSTSYGMRYVTKLMLNLRFVGEDDDGGGGRLIRGGDAETLRRAIMTTGADESRLLTMYGVKTISDLPEANYKGVQTTINAKYKAKLQAEGCDEDDIAEKIKRLWGAR